MRYSKGKSMSIDIDRPKTRQDKTRYVVATLLVLGLTSTLVQVATAASLGLSLQYDRWSTGGLLAFVGAIYMGVKCKTWEDWKRKIWIWVVLTALVALVVSYQFGKLSLSANTTTSGSEVSVLEPVEDGGPLTDAELQELRDARAEIDQRLWAFLDQQGSEEAEYKQMYQDLIARGDTEEEIIQVMDDMYWAGDVDEYQYCVMYQWYFDVAYEPISQEELVSTCTDWIVELWYQEMMESSSTGN